MHSVRNTRGIDDKGFMIAFARLTHKKFVAQPKNGRTINMCMFIQGSI